MASSSSRSQRTTGGSAARSSGGRSGSSASTKKTSGKGKGSAGKNAAKTRPVGKNGKRRLINYPRAGRGKIRRWVPSWRFVVGGMLSSIALVAGVVIAAYVTTELPEADEFAIAEKSVVYYSDGETVLTSYAEKDRVIIPSSDIPELTKQAVVAAEDRSFYENSGIDPKGIGRAVIGNVRALFSDVRRTGASTITQQYAERYYSDKTTSDYVGKFKEAILAIKADREYSKDEILTNYLNTIYLGRGAHGIESAANKYFGKSAKELTVSESAMIAGIIPSPTNWDPQYNMEKAQERWAYVLKGMVDKKWITQADRDAMVFPDVLPYEKTNKKEGPQGYLQDMVTKELAQLGITEEELERDGLRVVTTIDKDIQAQAVAAVAAMPEDRAPNLKTAVVTIDAATGGYLAVYGGADFLTDQYNSATMAVAQAGSTFKPFTLMAGLEAGKTLTDTFDGNSPKMFDKGKTPIRNFGGTSFGRVTLEKATQDSINTAYVELNEEVGPDKTVDAAVRAGIPEGTTDLSPVLSNVLGTASVHPVDMAAAYTTFATNGIVRTPHIIRLVTSKNSAEPPRYVEKVDDTTRAFSEDDTAELTYALTQVVEKGSGKTAASLNVPIAGKTGTSNENKSAWFVGYTPQFVTAVAMFQVGEGGAQEQITPFGKYAKKEITGATAPLDVWTEYMGAMLAGRPVVEFPERAKPTKPTETTTPAEEPSEEEVLPTEEAPPEPTTALVPGGLVGQSEDAARATLVAAGLNPSVSQRFDPTAPIGTVLSVNPGEGVEVAAGSTIAVVVSKGPEPTKTPPPTQTPSPTTPPTKEPTDPVVPDPDPSTSTAPAPAIPPPTP